MMKYKRCTTASCRDQLHKHEGTCAICGHFMPGYKHFLMSNFAHSKNSQRMVCILKRPTLLTLVAGTIVKPEKFVIRDRNHGSRKWKSPGSNHPRFSIYYFNKSAYYASLLFLALPNRYLTFTHRNSTHPTLNCREDF